MFEFAANGSGVGAQRLLRPGAFLRRWRPVHLNKVIQQMRFLYREAHGLAMMKRWFPECLGDIEPDESWLDILRHLMKLAEVENLFEPDWETMDYLWKVYCQLGDEEDEIESEMLRMMGVFVEHIPVKHYNYDEEEWLNGLMETVPLLALVRGLVDPAWGADISNLLIEYELYDLVPSDMDILNLPKRCEGLPEPLCWLPEMVHFVRRETGNPLLDGSVGIVDWRFPHWRWDSEQDMAEVQALSAAAQPRWQKIEDLLAWADGPEQVEEAVCLLMGVERGETDGD